MQLILRMGKVFLRKLTKAYVMQHIIYFFGAKRQVNQIGYVLSENCKV